MYLKEKINKLENEISSLTEKMAKLDEALILKAKEIFYSTNAAAQILQKSRAAVLDQIRKGKIVAEKTSPASKYSRYKISETEINRIINLKKDIILLNSS